MKKNKYEYWYIIQGYYINRWEDVYASENKQEALNNLRLYRENQPQFPHKLIQRRERYIYD